ncbi:MAG TPA: hypothetical protein VMR62_09650 [Bryobacteraceae bacterium]|jgi:streptogramin lyase|nr:hypothetical protein [Bryobacteraceae bacterium]
MQSGGFPRIAALFLSLQSISLAQQIAIGEYAVPTAASIPNAITAGSDGALWFTELDGNKIGRITTAGVLTEYPANGGPEGIVDGPGRALWFAAYEPGNIRRITTDGEVTASYPVLTHGGEPYGITLGPDGALWFTEYENNKIGRMTTAGVCTEYPVASTWRGPYAIIAGPDGALWFTELNGNRIGRITTAGVISDYLVPGSLSGPFWITVGPDGALWFTEAEGNKIGRITTAGAITEFPIPTANSGLSGIVTGPDGALWFTESAANQIGRITTAGTVTEYAMPSAGTWPFLITAGPDGALWFTDSTDKIGEIVFATAGLSVTPASGHHGDDLTFTGSGFTTGENVRIYISGVGSPVLASATADSSGSFSAAAPAPESPYGPRIFLGVGQSSGKLGTASFSVTPRLILDPNSGPSGSAVTASGYGFGPLETVDVYWNDPRISLGTATADVHGTFSGAAAFSFQVPEQAALGVDAVSGAGSQTGAHGGADFTVQ